MKKYALFILTTLAFNTAIGGVLTLLMPQAGFLHNLVFAQCVGLSIARSAA
jgi:hypothetical protein